MALGEEGGGGGIPATMLVGPANVGNGGMAYPYPVFGGFGGGGGGMGSGFGNDGGWIVLLLIIILVAAGGWGNNGGGNGAFGGQPIVINDGGGYGAVQRGFDQAAIMAALSGIQSGICSGFGDVQTSLCGGFAGVNATVNNGVNTITQQLYANTIADMQNSFAMQSKFSDCCCENRLATAQTQNVVTTEGAATRLAIQNQTQEILDKLCALEIQGKNDRIADLERQLTMANLQASQVAQTAQIQRGQVEEIDAMYNRLVNCPIPCEPVYGRQAIFTCNNNGCGCGGNTGGFNGNF